MEVDAQPQSFAHSLSSTPSEARFSPLIQTTQQGSSDDLTVAHPSPEAISMPDHSQPQAQQSFQGSSSEPSSMQTEPTPSPYSTEESASSTSSYPFYSQPPSQPQVERLSLNIPSLAVPPGTEGAASEMVTGGHSPVAPSPHPSTASTTLSPITPRSPADLRSTMPAHLSRSRPSNPSGGLSFPSHIHPNHTTGNAIFAYGPPDPMQNAPHNPAHPHSDSGFENAMNRNASAFRGLGMTASRNGGIGADISTLAGSTPQMSASSIPKKRSLAPLDVSDGSLMVDGSADGGGYSPVSASHLTMSGLSLAIPSANGTPGANGLYKYDEDPDTDLISASYDSNSGPTPPNGVESYVHPHYAIPQSRTAVDAEVSPVDGSLSAGSGVDDDAMLGGNASDAFRGAGLGKEGSNGISGYMNGTTSNATGQSKSSPNNFVSKLYQMINDPKSAHFIQWTELGTSFVVSNVGEFSRSILGVHFKHNNFSSFVRQLNMYGFHKINRTPRNQRGPASAGSANDTATQTWEFSHPKFLRGRPDLLEAIKRKALEPDPTSKARIELPGEVAAQLMHMRESQRRVVRALESERAKVEKLVGFVKCMSDVLARACPGSVPPFPPELWDLGEANPSILVTASAGPMSAGGRYMGSVMQHGLGLPTVQDFSPNSSPTAADFDFASHQHQQQQHAHPTHPMNGHPLGSSHHPLRHAQSMQHMQSYDTPMYAASSNTASSDGGSMDFDNGNNGDRKRQRTEIESRGRLSRARSDSVPVAYGNAGCWSRPRTGSGVYGNGAMGMGIGGLPKREAMMPNISGHASGSPLANVASKSG